MIIENEYNIGDSVYLKTDNDQNERIVSGVLIRKTHILYYLVCGTNESAHYDFELTVNKDVLKTTSN